VFSELHRVPAERHSRHDRCYLWRTGDGGSNAELRARERLTAAEVESLIEAAKGNRYGHRDATMVLLAYRHGLRACELVDLEWSQVDLKSSTLHVGRAKKGTPATHPIRGDESWALRKLQREQAPASSYVFKPRRKTPPDRRRRRR
jgi:integrase